MSMLLGKISGKSTPASFSFTAEGDPKKFDFIQVFHREHEQVLCQVVELVRDEDGTTGRCSVIGYKDDDGHVKPLRTPFEPGTPVLRAEDRFIQEIIQIDAKEGGYLGCLDGKIIPGH